MIFLRFAVETYHIAAILNNRNILICSDFFWQSVFSQCLLPLHRKTAVLMQEFDDPTLEHQITKCGL